MSLVESDIVLRSAAPPSVNDLEIIDGVVAQAYKEPVPFSERLARAPGQLGRAAATAAILAELHPLTNEGSRFAVFGAAKALIESPYAAAGAFTAATFAIEAGASVGLAKLLDSPTGARATSKVNSVLTALHVPIKSNFGIEAAITMIAGSPAATALKHMQDPTRSVRTNMRYALLSSTVISAVTGGESLLIAEGIAAPSPPTIGLAFTGVGIAIGVAKWAHNKIKRAKTAPKADTETSMEALSEPSLIDYKTYRKIIHEAEEGPQIVGFNETDFNYVEEDVKTHYVTIEIDGKPVRWPLTSPIENFSEYMPSYFDGHYGSHQSVYYASLPPRGVLDANPELRQEIAFRLALQSANKDITLVYDELDGQNSIDFIQDELRRVAPDAQVFIDHFIDVKNGTPAAANHFEALLLGDGTHGNRRVENPVRLMRDVYQQMISQGEIDLDVPEKTVLLDPMAMDQQLPGGIHEGTILQNLWETYERQFTKLIENHPARGKQTFEELEAMIKHPDTLTAAHIVNGEIVSFTMFVSNIKACDWLNPQFYDERFPNDNLFYFPGIATAAEHEGKYYSFHLIKLLSHLATRSVDRIRIVFQCTNVSEKYVPRGVKYGIKASGEGDIDVNKICHYNYRGLRIVVPELMAEAKE